jgi:hypothetical protein
MLLKVASRLRHWDADRRRVAMNVGLAGVRGNTSPRVWEAHYRNFLQEGWRYFRASNFVHRCTDGPECPYAFTYTVRSVAPLFAQFRSMDVEVAHFPLNKYRGARFVPRAVERAIARAIGWQLLIRATK